MRTTRHLRSMRSALGTGAAMVLAAMLTISPETGKCQTYGQPQGTQLYNEFLGQPIWISPSQRNPNAVHVILPSGIQRDVVVGGLSFYGTTPTTTSYSGYSGDGNAVSSDGRSVTLRPDGSFELSVGAISGNCWNGGGMYSASIPADDGAGLYGLYRDPQMNGTLIYFFYRDGRWGFGLITPDGKLQTDKGTFQAQ